MAQLDEAAISDANASHSFDPPVVGDALLLDPAGKSLHLHLLLVTHLDLRVLADSDGRTLLQFELLLLSLVLLVLVVRELWNNFRHHVPHVNNMRSVQLGAHLQVELWGVESGKSG